MTDAPSVSVSASTGPASSLPGSLAAYWPALLLGLLSLIVFIAATLQPRAGATRIGVIVTPLAQTSAAQLVAETDARIIGGGQGPGIWILSSDRPGFAEQLQQAGGVLLFDPGRLADCL